MNPTRYSPGVRFSLSVIPHRQQYIANRADNGDMSTQLLPLFPLSIVLLPATPLPLHIFEDRYKEMMGDVIPVRGEFGIVLAKEDGIVSVGCTATVDRIFRRYRECRLDLLAIGHRRFQVVWLDEEKSYLRAEGEYLNDKQ